MSDEYKIHLKIKTLENGQFLATSDDLPGLVAQGRTVSETVDIARDVAKKLIESFLDHGDPLPSGLRKIDDKIEVDVAVGI
jgi:predicted RNase H-like HicB family nuclease